MEVYIMTKSVRTIPLLLLVLLTFSSVRAVTVGKLPQLEGEVFAVQLGPNELVAVLVFSGEKYTEYTFDAEKGALTPSAEGVAENVGPNLWTVQVEAQETCVAYAYAEEKLTANGVTTGLVKVDYSNPEQEIPVLPETLEFPGCWVACNYGCCPCCFCIHRRLHIPGCVDSICCRWAGQVCT